MRLGLADLSRASSLAGETIQNAARLMFPHVRQLSAGLPSAFRREDAIARIEARYPIDASINSMETILVKLCTNIGLDGDVTAAAQQLLAAVQVPSSAAYRAAYYAAAKPTPLAASAAWLALQLKGGACAKIGAKELIESCGVTLHDLHVAARAVFPYVRELAAALPPPMRTPEALARIEADHSRMLGLGAAVQQAPAIAAAAAAAAAASDDLPAAHVPLQPAPAANEAGAAPRPAAPTYWVSDDLADPAFF